MSEGRKITGDERREKNQKLTGTVMVIITMVIAFSLISSTYQAYAEGLKAVSEKERLDPRIEAMEMRLQRETSLAIQRLDPDYRRAVYERDRGILSPGEELLPIYDDDK